MAARNIISVLLHVGSRKKVVNIPSSSFNHYKILQQEVSDWTGETVKCIEKFDLEWDEWIEVETTFQAINKDRLKAIILDKSGTQSDFDNSSSGEVCVHKLLYG